MHRFYHHLVWLGYRVAMAPLMLVTMGAMAAGQTPAPVEPRVVVAKKADATSKEPSIPTLPPVPTAADADSGAATPESSAGDAWQLPVEHHPWGRFAPGAWRIIRTTTESFDAAGKFVARSESTQTETLVAISGADYTIETTTTLDVGGKKLRGATQQTTLSLLTDSASPLVEVEPLPDASLTIGGRVLSCQQWRLTSGAGPQRRIETLHYNADLSPYVLRREAIAADSTDAATEVQSLTRVVRVDVPVELEEGFVPGNHVTITSQTGTQQSERMEVRSDVVPGGLVSATWTERDAEGRRIRWSSTELVEFGQAGETPAPDPPRWRLFRRRAR